MDTENQQPLRRDGGVCEKTGWTENQRSGTAYELDSDTRAYVHGCNNYVEQSVGRLLDVPHPMDKSRITARRCGKRDLFLPRNS